MLQFVRSAPGCVGHLTMLAVTGTLGQLCIYFTISRFGPVLFSTLMASRQVGLHFSRFVCRALPLRMSQFGVEVVAATFSVCAKGVLLLNVAQVFSLAVSAAIFGHEISYRAMPFAVLVFAAMVYEIRKRAIKRRNDAQVATPASTRAKQE